MDRKKDERERHAGDEPEDMRVEVPNAGDKKGVELPKPKNEEKK
jgi:hypothetical protein